MSMTAEQWNESHPVGTQVIAYPGARPGVDGDPSGVTRLHTTTRSVAWQLPSGPHVVCVEGYSGGICLTHVDPVPAAYELGED